MMITTSEKQTIALGKKYALQLKAGAVLGLVGELGAGKTQFAKGLAHGLGVKGNITSPTFVLLKKYSSSKRIAAHSGIKNLIHIDCYRLANRSELEDLGFYEFIQDNNNIIVVEWADKIKSIMPPGSKWVNFNIGKKNNERIISF